MSFSELELLEYMKFTSEQPILVDVGANRGPFSYAFARKGWRVIAFEPEPENRSKFIDNLARFEDVQCIPKAVSDISGQIVPFYVSDDHSGIHSLKPFHRTHRQAFQIETVRLDDALEEIGISQVTLLKIDIEGADFLALKGLSLDKYGPELVMLEFMDSRSLQNFGYTHHDVAAHMAVFGYSTFVSEWEPIIEYACEGETPSHTWIQCKQYPLDHEPAWGNLICVPTGNEHRLLTALQQYQKSLVWKTPLKDVRRKIGRIPGAKSLYHTLVRTRLL